MNKILSPVLILISAIIFAVFAAIFIIVVIVDIRKAKKAQVQYHLRQSLTALLFILPAALLAFFFVLLPILFSLGYGFTNYTLLKPKALSFRGFLQFEDVISDFARGGKVWISFRNTAVFVVFVVPLQITLALLLALFCNAKMKGNAVFKICFFVPVAVSLAVTSFLWKIILGPDDSDLLNTIVSFFGGQTHDYLNEDTEGITTMLWIVVVSAWQGCGYQMLIFLSGLTGIRKDLYEAARMDGCNAFMRFFKVTLPGLKPTLVYVLITVFIGAARIMVQPMLMVGYQDNSRTLSLYMYEQGFKNMNVAFSSAIALLMTIILGGITLIQRKLLGEKK